MAYGSSRQMRRYVNKVFKLEERLAKLTDGRNDPMVPLAPILFTWFWALARRTPSTEQVGDLLADPRWRKRVGLEPKDGGSPDTAGRALDTLMEEEVQELALQAFLDARHAKLLKDDGPYGLRCLLVDLNELFKSEKVHCSECQVREKTVKRNGEEQLVKEYYHQAVALVWASGETPWPIGWELLRPGEGELTAAVRLLTRLLPRLRKSADLVLGDGLYCCRPFFKVVHGNGLKAFAISSEQTEMDEEMNLLMQTESPRMTPGKVAVWEMESEAWSQDLKCKLRVLHYERRYAAKSWRHERRMLRAVTSAPVDVMPAGQGWKVGRCRWQIENGTFNILTRAYELTHNYRHSPTAIVMLLVLRSLAYCLTQAYFRFATGRSRDAPRFIRWFKDILEEDWVRYLDAAGAAGPARVELRWSG